MSKVDTPIAGIVGAVICLAVSPPGADSLWADDASELIAVVKAGDTEKVKLLLGKGADPNVSDRFGTALHHAVRGHHKDVVEILAAGGADVKQQTKDGWTSLHSAASRDTDAAITRFLIAKGADVHAKYKENTTPLHCAVSKGNENPARVLIAAGADVNAKDTDGRTPAQSAILGGHGSVLQLLVENGARVTPYVAAALGEMEKLKSFLDGGIDVNARDQFGRALLHSAACMGQKKMAEFLIARGAEVNAKDKLGYTPLHSTAWKNHRDVARVLIASGADVNAKNKHGSTPLLRAAERGYTDIVSLLIKAGANVNLKHGADWTALHSAAWSGQEKTAAQLIANGADVNVKNKYGMTPLLMAARNGHKDLVEMLLGRGADATEKDNEGTTALHQACTHIIGSKRRGPAIAQIFIAKGLDLNATDQQESTPLHSATWAGNGDIVEFLVANGADLHRGNKKGWTPLHVAAYTGREGIAAILIAKGANLNEQNKEGMTPLHLAAWTGNKGVVELLIREGTHINAQDKTGCTPLDLAHQYKSIRDLLHGRGGKSKTELAGTARRKSSEEKEISGRVLDADGKPAARVDVATSWRKKGGRMMPVAGVWTDKNGRFSMGLKIGKHPVALLAMDRERNRGGIVVLKGKNINMSPVIELVPLIHIHGKFFCKEMDKPPEWTNVILTRMPEGIGLVERPLRSHTFSLKVPPGSYLFHAYGTDVESIDKQIALSARNPDVDMGTINLEPTIIAQHFGKAPPAWHVTDARGVDKHVELSAFRGKWVLLDFWGHWCGPCLQGLSQLIELYEEHKDQRDHFEILAFHTKDIKTFEELDKKLEPIIAGIWKGKTLPFPILLDSTGATIKDYGINAFPTTILIDPEGRIVQGHGDILLRRKLEELKQK